MFFVCSRIGDWQETVSAARGEGGSGRRVEDQQRQCKHYCSQTFGKVEDLCPVYNTHADKQAEKNSDGNISRFHRHVWLESAIFGNHPYRRWNLVLSIRHYNPETKWQSMACCSLSSPPPKKSRPTKSKIKTMLIAFFGSKGLIHHQFVLESKKLSMRKFTGEFWNSCCYASGRFGQNCTRVDKYSPRQCPSAHCDPHAQLSRLTQGYCSSTPSSLSKFGASRLLFVSPP